MSVEFEKIVLEKLDNMEKEIGSLRTDLNEVKEEVGSLRTDLNEVKEEVGSLRTDLNEVKEDLAGLKEKVNEIDKSVILIENTVTTQLPALFEIYSLNYELQKEERQKAVSLELTTLQHSNRIANLENITERHSKQLKKLIS